MRTHKMQRDQCDGCAREEKAPNDYALVDTVPVLTLSGERRIVEVKRCINCDAAECNNCREKTMRINQVRCDGCGQRLVPKDKRNGG